MAPISAHVKNPKKVESFSQVDKLFCSKFMGVNQLFQATERALSISLTFMIPKYIYIFF